MIHKFLPAICLTLLFCQQFATAQQNIAIEKSALENLGAEVMGYTDKNLAVGAELFVIQAEQVLYHSSFGLADRESKRAWQNNTVCNIRSMTKPITSAAAQILIDRKLLELDVPVAKYLESFDNEDANSITVRQVLTHRSGLPLTNITSLDRFRSLEEQVDSAGESGPQFEPDSKFWYSDLGTDVVGRLVEKVSGKLLHEFVESELLVPLGMTSTFYGIEGDDARLSKAASTYMKGGGTGWIQFWKSGSKPIYNFAWGSQTIYSTTSDYARFIKMLLNRGRAGSKQILSEAAVNRMLAPVSRAKGMATDTKAPTGFVNLEPWYGQMMVTYHPVGKEKSVPTVIGHSGSDGTNAWGWPDKDLTIVYFTQSRGGFTPLRIEEAIDRLLFPEDESETPEKLKPYLGTFIANYGKFKDEEFVVKARNGKLILDVPSQLPFELLAPDSDGNWAFVIAPKQMKVGFNRDDKNEIVGLTIYKGPSEFNVPKKGTEAANQPATSEIASNANATTWIGTVDTGKSKLRLEIPIVRDGESLNGFVRSLDQNNIEIPMTEIISDDESLSFACPSINAKFAGKFSNEGDVVDGTLKQNGKEMPLMLTKSDKTTETTVQEKLEAAWVGKIDISGMQPVMQFRIVKLESGETKAYFDSITEGLTGFEAKWSIDGDKLNFDVAEIKLTYRGTLNIARDQAEGTWSQGGRDVPLSLAKKDKAVEK